ncbi:putative hsp70 binding protein hspbp [Schistosoma mansoni]|uniref:Putative hsp70 binding protein hspbp n=1 Tax=Schistosoma mansoni TaxID=6183 RepID=G4VIK7_SCHMA|nr:putative hsp70 binding protein hspbp [Schistosoma mansoni]|eukprot:XP_018651863.1 putative hsp70 binding protein hspbp [Schistosoma mansoni]
MARNLQGLLRLAAEHSENAATKPMDPKDAEWLNEALSASTVDLTKQLTNDVQTLSSHLSSSEPDLNEMKNVIEDLLTLTEELDLSNDFLIVGGQDVLLKLLFCGPPSLRIDGLKLLGNITQNNPRAQSLYTENGVLARLIMLFEEETDLEFLRYLLLAISCITRGYEPAISVFLESKGVDLVLSVLIREVKIGKSDKVYRLVSKGAFLVYCVMQELASKRIQSESFFVVHKVIDLLYLLDDPQEHLLATLTLLLYPLGSHSNIQSEEPYKSFSNWLQRHLDELRKKDDPADEERRNNIDCLLKVLS